MFEQVIVPIDGSDLGDRAVAAARLVAHALRVPVVLVRATHPDDLDEVTGELRERALQLDTPDAELVIDSFNDPVGAIVEAVRARPNSLVCMSTHGRDGIGRALFGSITEGALTEAEAPFLLVGPHADVENLRLGDVLVPLDGSHRAESILPVVTEWARATGGSLLLVEVVDTKAAATVEPSGEVAYVKRIADGLPDDLTGVEWDVLHGKDPAATICEHAAEHDLPIIALATHGHTGLSRLVAGSVSTRVVHDHTGITLVIRTAEPED